MIIHQMLFYEGEYLKGKKWNGKGKEYDNNILIFDGEYFEEKNGKEKEKNIKKIIY